MPEHTVKLSIRVSNWPFYSLSNSLGIVLSPNTRSGDNTDECVNEDIDNSGNLIWLTVMVDNVYLYPKRYFILILFILCIYLF